MTKFEFSTTTFEEDYLFYFIREHFFCQEDIFLFYESCILGHMTSEQVHFIVYFENDLLVIAVLAEENIEFDIVHDQEELLDVISYYMNIYGGFDPKHDPEVFKFINFLRRLDYKELLEKSIQEDMEEL